MSTTVTSEIPATVWQVKVAVGDQVDVDDELVVLESMKMEIPVLAPVAGTVTALHVAPEDRVAEGDPVADIG
ncbi:MAG: biotin/lipoyl-binding carrier protein [Desertimonas sp.]